MRDSIFDPTEELARVGFRLNSFAELKLDKSLSAIADIGFQVVELCLEHPELDPAKLTDSRLSKLKKALTDAGLRVSALSCHRQDGDLSDLFENRLKALDVAGALETPLLVIGMVPESRDPGGRQSFEYLYKLLVEASDKGIRVAVGTEPDSVLHGYYDFNLLTMNMSGLPLGMNLNLPHLALTEGDVSEVVFQSAPFIFQTYISDSPRHQHAHLLPGEGQQDIQRVLNALRRTNYKGDYILDVQNGSSQPAELAQSAFTRFQAFLDPGPQEY